MYMKAAISSEGDSADSQVSDKGGRAPYYLLFENGKQIRSIRNPFQSGGGAGFAVASMLADEKVGLVISRNFGENMTDALAERNIRWKIVESITVKEALKGLMDY